MGLFIVAVVAGWSIAPAAPEDKAAGVSTGAVPEALQKRINRAIDQGVAYLKGKQRLNGPWPGYNAYVGACALPGLALLESGVAVGDPVVQKAAAVGRKN